MNIKQHLPPAVKALPVNSKVWVYQADRLLNKVEVETINTALKRFVNNWLTHGKPVKGLGFTFMNAFAVLIADSSFTEITGCSIDSSVHAMKEMGKQLNINFFSTNHLAWLAPENEIRITPLHEFRQALLTNENTKVFQNNISTLEQLSNNWLIPYEQSAIKRLVESATDFNLTL